MPHLGRYGVGFVFIGLIKMAIAGKRRSSASRGGFTLNKRTREVLSLSLLGVAAFILLSVVSDQFHAVSPYLSATSAGSPNIMGPVGELVAVSLWGAFGWCAFLPTLWLSWIAYRLWNGASAHERPVSLLYFTIGVAGAFTALSALLFAVGGRAFGGTVGAALGRHLVLLTGTGGTILLSAIIFLGSLGIASRGGLGAIASGLGEGVSASGRALAYSVPTMLLRPFLQGAVFLFQMFYYLLRAVVRGLLAGVGFVVGSVVYLVARIFAEQEEDEERDEGPEVRGVKSVKEPIQRSEPPTREEPIKIVLQRSPAETAQELVRKPRKPVKRIVEESADTVPYSLPEIDLLTQGETTVRNVDDQTFHQQSSMIEQKLLDFSIAGRVTHVHPGPVITLYEFEPAAGVKVGKIASLQDDLAMSLKASSIRIIAPIPGKGTVGIEVPNRQREIVRLRDVLESHEFTSAETTLAVAIGKDTYGVPVVAELSNMPHLLMAGATGAGKSVCLNTILMSLLYRATPEELGLIMIDPKILELSIYEGIPHLRVPVVTAPRQAKAVLEWAVHEMNRRYRLMQKYGVRNIDGYNRIVRGEDSPPEDRESSDSVITLREERVVEPGTENLAAAAVDSDTASPVEELKILPKLVIVIDELADLMLTAGREVESLITRLAQKARASGIHLIVATQRPSVDVVTGLIKANFPARLSFRVSSRVDSRTILDSMGAEKLLGRGDMLLMQPEYTHIRRVHGAYVSDAEVKRVIDSIKSSATPQYDQRIIEACEKAMEEEKQATAGEGEEGEFQDSLYDKSVELVLTKGQASTSMIQRAFRIGYNRAARIIEMMEREGVVGPADGAKPRQIMVPTEREVVEG